MSGFDPIKVTSTVGQEFVKETGEHERVARAKLAFSYALLVMQSPPSLVLMSLLHKLAQARVLRLPASIFGDNYGR
jgi:hypothetical protein